MRWRIVGRRILNIIIILNMGRISPETRAKREAETMVEVYRVSPSEDAVRRMAEHAYLEGYRRGAEDKEEELRGEVDETIAALDADERQERDFLVFWNTYDKKIDKNDCRKVWARLTKRDRMLALKHVPIYVAYTPDKQFRKNPLTYLRRRAWLDEIIPTEYARRQQQILSHSEQVEELAAAIRGIEIDK